jgi:hypothetical protein
MAVARQEGEKWDGDDKGLGFPLGRLAGATREGREEEMLQIKVDVNWLVADVTVWYHI